MVIILVLPLMVFGLLLEWRRFVLTDYYEPYIAKEGSLHLATTACGPVEGYLILKISPLKNEISK